MAVVTECIFAGGVACGLERVQLQPSPGEVIGIKWLNVDKWEHLMLKMIVQIDHFLIEISM